MHGLSMETIISDLPELNLSEEVEICYQEYVRQCKKANKLIKYPRSVWPDGMYGGSEQPVSFLLGIRGVEMDVILRHRGLYFVRTNINSGKEQDIISMGGTWETNKDEVTSDFNFLGMTVTKYPMITEETFLKNKTYKSYWDSIEEEKKIKSDSEDTSETRSDNISNYEFMDGNYEYNDKHSSETEEDEEAVIRALQISLLEEENKVVKMKDLQDNLSSGLNPLHKNFSK